MHAPPARAASLDEIRREIDAIDDGILDLVARRLAAVAEVRRIKERSDALAQSPIRPAREAFILRRLLERAGGRVPPELCLRLWRALIASATLSQARIGIHMSDTLMRSAEARLLLGEYFGEAETVSHPDETAAFAAIAGNGGDIAAVAPDAAWIEPFRRGAAGQAQAICCLPFLTGAPAPRLLVFGHAPPEPTGDDETLVIAHSGLPSALAPRWQLKAGDTTIAGLPGYLAEDDLRFTGLMIAGRYPSPLQARS